MVLMEAVCIPSFLQAIDSIPPLTRFSFLLAEQETATHASRRRSGVDTGWNRLTIEDSIVASSLYILSFVYLQYKLTNTPNHSS